MQDKYYLTMKKVPGIISHDDKGIFDFSIKIAQGLLIFLRIPTCKAFKSYSTGVISLIYQKNSLIIKTVIKSKLHSKSMNLKIKLGLSCAKLRSSWGLLSSPSRSLV